MLVLDSDYITEFGDLFAYWCADPQTVSFCSRSCAIAYSNENNLLLVRVTDSLYITPHQSYFDQYAREHNLEGVLAIMESDTWESPEEELRALLKAPRLVLPDRYFTLGMVLLDRGMNSLGEAAVQKMLDNYPLATVITYCSFLRVLSARLRDLS
jgi:hypothetical protein